MNWFKKSQLGVVEQDRKNPSQRAYTNIGHEIHNKVIWMDESAKGAPNYMWAYIDGRIDIEEETEQMNGHGAVERWRGVPWGKVYGGRYSGREKIITVMKPKGGVSEFRDIPSSLTYLLRQNFPDAEQIYSYSSSKNWYNTIKTS